MYCSTDIYVYTCTEFFSLLSDVSITGSVEDDLNKMREENEKEEGNPCTTRTCVSLPAGGSCSLL